MIYTVTCNPSLDYFLTTDGFCEGQTNRALYEEYKPGGKGINVSIVLKQMGIESVAIGFLAGFTGEEIDRQIKRYGISTDFVRLARGTSRINVKLKSMDGTEINAQGPKISEEDLEALFERIEHMDAGDYLVLSGSLAPEVPKDLYRQLMKQAQKRGVVTLVDVAGKPLLETLPLHPFLVKPNKQELEELFGVKISSKEEIVSFAKKLQELGAVQVLVSLGAEGAVYVDETRTAYSCKPPKGTLVNAVGAGDSMVAGFLTGICKKESGEMLLRRCVATGSATAFCEDFATAEMVEEYLRA